MENKTLLLEFVFVVYLFQTWINEELVMNETVYLNFLKLYLTVSILKIILLCDVKSFSFQGDSYKAI